jgi:ketosteroid isomerase-like protein
MENQNSRLLNSFYTAFANHDAEAMAQCYHADVVFSDPAFGELKGKQAAAMWKMLIERSKGKLDISFSDIQADEKTGSANWIAKYAFSKTGRNVTNHVHAAFEFKDGLILRHKDAFNFHKWAAQALGWKGRLLGGTSFMQEKVRKQALQSLENYSRK